LGRLGRSTGEALALAGEDVSMGAAFALGEASTEVKRGVNVAKWIGISLVAVVAITAFGFLREAVK